MKNNLLKLIHIGKRLDLDIQCVSNEQEIVVTFKGAKGEKTFVFITSGPDDPGSLWHNRIPVVPSETLLKNLR